MLTEELRMPYTCPTHVLPNPHPTPRGQTDIIDDV